MSVGVMNLCVFLLALKISVHKSSRPYDLKKHRLKTKSEKSTHLTYTGLFGELEHLKIGRTNQSSDRHWQATQQSIRGCGPLQSIHSFKQHPNHLIVPLPHGRILLEALRLKFPAYYPPGRHHHNAFAIQNWLDTHIKLERSTCWSPSEEQRPSLPIE